MNFFNLTINNAAYVRFCLHSAVTAQTDTSWKNCLLKTVPITKLQCICVCSTNSVDNRNSSHRAN